MRRNGTLRLNGSLVQVAILTRGAESQQNQSLHEPAGVAAGTPTWEEHANAVNAIPLLPASSVYLTYA